MPVPEITAIIRQCLQGDQNAYQQIIQQYKRFVFSWAYATTCDYYEAEDLAQEIFIQVYQSLARLKEPEKFTAWLRGIAQHLCVDWLRKKQRRLDMSLNLESIPEPTAPVTDPTGASKKQALYQQVILKLNELPEEMERILTLRYLQDLSYKKIALALGMTISAVGERLFRARLMLEDKLKGLSID